MRANPGNSTTDETRRIASCGNSIIKENGGQIKNTSQKKGIEKYTYIRVRGNAYSI